MNLMLALFTTFFKIGLFSFGGGYAMIAFIQREIVDTHHWLGLREFIDVVGISQMTPGPIAVNAATYVGYKVNGVAGAAAATLGVTMPALFLMMGLAYLMKRFSSLPAVNRFFTGVRPAVVALITMAAWVIGKEAFVTGYRPILIAVVVLAALIKTKINPILLLAFAGFLGAVLP